MSSEISKAYQPGEVERKWYARWQEGGCFRADPDSGRPPYSIVIPPPNVTGRLTLGHVLNNALQDILARRAWMTGHEVLWLPGTDHAGIATQTVVERLLRGEGKTRADLGRERFLERVWAWKEEYGGIIIEQLKRLGCACDWSRERFTMDPDYTRAVEAAFVRLHREGHIYRGRRMVNWCPVSMTALSDEEVIMTPTRGKLYTMRYELVDRPGETLEIATTRPETLMGDTAVAVNPRDPRYAGLIGRRCWRPFPRAQIPIVGDEAIDPEFGTGVLKVTPAHDRADYEIGLRHGLEIIDIMNPDGTMNALAGEGFDGMDRMAARARAVEMLQEAGLFVREEPYQHNVGYSERANVPIEPRLSEQWFLRYPAVREAIEAVRSGEIEFVPARYVKVFDHWMENIQDWCISRQLWWGHRIPVWYHRKDRGRLHVDVEPPPDEAEWERDPDVLDTWFSSWLWPFATMDDATLARFYPTSALVTGWDILFFWVARMMMAGYHFTGRRPFGVVYLTGLIRDSQKRKMSKSLGNSPDPLDLIDRYGADGLRLGLMRIMPHGQDTIYIEKQIEEGRNFANKVWNACRFRQMQGPCAPEPAPGGRALSDYALDILAGLDGLVAAVDGAYGEYRFGEIANLVYDFFWSDYCDWFIEASKSDIYGEDAGARAATLEVMDAVLHVCLRLLHPLMPHLTEELWERLGFRAPSHRGDGGFLMFARAPVPGEVLEGIDRAALGAARERARALYATARAARNLRAECNISSGQKVRFELRATGVLGRDVLDTLGRLVNASEIACLPEDGGAVRAPTALTALGRVSLPLEGLIDVEAERRRIGKEIERLEGELRGARGKLENPDFTGRAPAEVVAEMRRRAGAAEERLGRLREMLSMLS